MSEKSIKKRYKKLSSYLNEKTRRLWCANEAIALGHGGISLVSKITGVSRTTICEGKKEVVSKDDEVRPLVVEGHQTSQKIPGY